MRPITGYILHKKADNKIINFFDKLWKAKQALKAAKGCRILAIAAHRDKVYGPQTKYFLDYENNKFIKTEEK